MIDENEKSTTEGNFGNLILICENQNWSNQIMQHDTFISAAQNKFCVYNKIKPKFAEFKSPTS